MPPRKSAAAASAAAAASGGLNVAHDNTAVLRRVEDNLAHMLGHKEFKNVQIALPLGFAKEAFNKSLTCPALKRQWRPRVAMYAG